MSDDESVYARHVAAENFNQNNIFDTRLVIFMYKDAQLLRGLCVTRSRSGCDGLMRDNGSGADTVAASPAATQSLSGNVIPRQPK